MSIESIVSLISKRAKGLDRIVIALSGGVDSGLVAAAAYKALGKRAVAVTVMSELTAPRDFSRAAEVSETIGIEHHPLCMRVLSIDAVRCNAEDRCYHCKRSIFELMILEYGDDCLIMDGTNADDDPARPGLRAVREFDVFSPLQAAGITKQQCRELAHSIGLPNWNAPSESCLATRIPVGTPLSVDGVQKVQEMESFFHDLGVDTLRVSHDNLVATVNYMPQYADIIDKNRDSFAALIKRIGLRSYRFKEWRE